jgi:hypothetical protein
MTLQQEDSLALSPRRKKTLIIMMVYFFVTIFNGERDKEEKRERNFTHSKVCNPFLYLA